MTLAPEMTTPELIAKLTAAGVVVSAGHTNATYDQIRTALRHGLTGFTHLFNAMSQLTGREPGVVGAALDDADSWCGIIVDGHHVDPAVLRIALRCKRHDRFMLVTDAMPSVGAAEKSFTLQGRMISVADGVLVDENGTLAGSDIDMATTVRNAIELLGLDLPEAVRMASQYPAEFLGLGGELGRIAPGYRANLVLADDSLDIIETWIDGETLTRAHEHCGADFCRTTALSRRAENRAASQRCSFAASRFLIRCAPSGDSLPSTPSLLSGICAYWSSVASKT